MSDCSTEAMKPKEPPKTCGNCDLNDAIRHLDDLLANDEFPCDECRADHEQLRGWLVGLQSLEQCYQQLEQVAWELYAVALSAWKEARCLAGPQVKRSIESREEHLSRLKAQLEALGVEIDG